MLTIGPNTAFQSAVCAHTTYK